MKAVIGCEDDIFVTSTHAAKCLPQGVSDWCTSLSRSLNDSGVEVGKLALLQLHTLTQFLTNSGVT